MYQFTDEVGKIDVSFVRSYLYWKRNTFKLMISFDEQIFFRFFVAMSNEYVFIMNEQFSAH